MCDLAAQPWYGGLGSTSFHKNTTSLIHLQKTETPRSLFSCAPCDVVKMHGVVRNRNKANIPIISISGIIMKGCCIKTLLLLCPGSHKVAESLTVMSLNLNNTHIHMHTHTGIFSRILAKTWLNFPIKCWNKTHSQNHKQAYLCCYSQEAASSLQAKVRKFRRMVVVSQNHNPDCLGSGSLKIQLHVLLHFLPIISKHFCYLNM